MKECPECKGRKQFTFPSDDPLDVYRTDGPTVYKTTVCATCAGKGEVSDLTWAVYTARGGPAPIRPIFYA